MSKREITIALTRAQWRLVVSTSNGGDGIGWADLRANQQDALSTALVEIETRIEPRRRTKVVR